MSKMRTIALGGALVCAVVAGLLARNVMSRKQDQHDVLQHDIVSTVETVDVLVASKDLQMGDKLTDATVWTAWPKANVLPYMINKNDKPNAMKDLAGARVRLPTYKDEPVMDKKILLAGAGGFMSASLPKGMRGISVAISNRSAAGGFILPNDRVDVILTVKSTATSATGAAPKILIHSEVVLSNVRVLAVNQVFKQAGDTDPVTVEKGETATLELAPKQAEIIAQVESSGELSLALRSISENDGKTAEQIFPELEGKFKAKANNTAELKSGDPLFVRAGIESYATPQ